MTDACCAPAAPHDPEVPARAPSTRRCSAPGTAPATLVHLPGGPFPMGDDSVWAYPDDGEGPVHEVEVRPLLVDAYTVSNARFAEFVDATGHRTDAERYEWSFVFAGFLPDDFPDTACGGQRTVVAAGVRGRLASPRRPALRSRRPRRPPGRPRVVERRARRTARGRAPASRPKRSGSTPRAEASSGTRSRGATTSSPTASTA